MNRWAFLNNEFIREDEARLHFSDLAIQRGYGVFDFFKVVNYIPVFLSDHLERFYFSAHHMRLPVPFTSNELKDIIYRLIQKNDIADCGIRITLTGGYSPDGFQSAAPNFILSKHTFQPPGKEQIEKGIKLIIYPHQRQLPHVKTIDYLMAIWLQPIIEAKGADDVLYHQNGIITECPRSNFFLVTKDEKIVTPSENILKGITRKKILETAGNHFKIEERSLTKDEIKTAKEAFITSTTKMILPVSQIDNHIFERQARSITTQLINILANLIIRSNTVQNP